MTDFGMRQTLCECGHMAVEHYDSWMFCTWSIDGDCNCQKFVAAGPEVEITWSTPDGPPASSTAPEATE